MKHSTGILTAITLIAVLVFTGCDRPSNQSNQMENAETSVIESNRDLEIAKAEVEADYQKYKLENQNRMSEYNRTIDEIKQEIENESDTEVRARHENRLQEYEVKHRELNREMDNYRISGRESWNSFKDSFSNRMDNLGDSLDNFFSTSGTTTTSRN